MSSFLEQICTKQSFVHEQCSSVEELFSHSVAIRDMEPNKFPILFINEVMYYE